MLTAEQLEERTGAGGFLGGSEITAALGLNPWKAPVDLWLEKTGARPGSAGNPRTECGTRFEAPIADWYAELEGARLATSPSVRHPSEPWIGCTPDRLVVTEEDGIVGAIQVKCVGVQASYSWGDAPEVGSEDWWRYQPAGVPRHVRLQVAWELLTMHALWGIDVEDVVALIGTDLRVYAVERDEELEQALVEGARAFWDCVVQDEPPAIDGSESWLRLLEQRFPRDVRAELLPASEESVEQARRYLKASSLMARVEAERDRAANELRAAIGDAAGIKGAGIRATWKANRNGKRTLRVTEEKTR